MYKDRIYTDVFELEAVDDRTRTTITAAISTEGETRHWRMIRFYIQPTVFSPAKTKAP